MQRKKVSAIILNYNSSSDCKKCIGFLKKQDYESLSLIVVDNASPKTEEREILQKLCEENSVQLIFNLENGGFSAGNNIGLRAAVKAGAEWMLVINPDVELRDPHYISYVMEQIPKWPETAVVGTNVFLPSGEQQNPMREVKAWEEILWPLENIKQRLGIWDGYRSKDETGYCEKVSGCCFFISKEFLEKNNYLDESVFMYCEEPILEKCVIHHGYRELYVREVTANHEHYAQAKAGDSKSKMPMFLKSRLYYIENYSGYKGMCKRMAVASRKIQVEIWKNKKYFGE